jgi:uncharacterized protein
MSEALRRQGCLGLVPEPVSCEIAQALGAMVQKGVWVRNVIPGSAACTAGIEPGDVILSVDSEPVYDRMRFLALIRHYQDGDRCLLRIARQGRVLSKNIQLQALPLETHPEMSVIYSHIQSQGRRLRIIVTVPKGKEVCSSVFFLQGLECMSVDFPLDDQHPYKRILYEFTHHGFATIRLERSGTGDSEGDLCKDIDFNTEKHDYYEAARQTRELDCVDGDRFFLFGYSMGGVFAPIVAKQLCPKGIAVFGTIGRFWNDYVLETARRQRMQAGKSIQIEKDLSRLRKFLFLLNTKKLHPSRIVDLYPEYRTYVVDSKYVHNRHYSFFQQLSDVDILREWAELPVPALIVSGNADSVALDDDQLAIYRVLSERTPPIAANLIQADVDHTFKQATKLNGRRLGVQSREFSRETVARISRWYQAL